MRYIALLRGINVAGQKLIKMDALKLHFEMPGFSNIVTYIQSGNVLFDSKETDTSKLCKKVEKQLAAKLGYDVPVVIRSLGEIQTAIKNNPFTKLKESDTRKLYIVYLSDAPSAAALEFLKPYTSDTEELKLIDRELYIVTEGIGNSKLTLNIIEKKLGVTGTMRNLATSNKILTL